MQKITYSLKSVGQDVEKILALLIEVMGLDISNLLKFRRAHNISRRPAPSNESLPLPQPLNPHYVPNRQSIIANIINAHLPNQQAVIDVDGTNTIVIFFREDEEKNLVIALTNILKEWQANISPSLLTWKCQRFQENNLLFSSRNFSYLTGILAYSSQETLQEMQGSCSFQKDSRGEEVLVKSFSASIGSDEGGYCYLGAETWIRETNIRIDANKNFIEDIRVTCESLDAHEDRKLQTVIGMFLKLCGNSNDPKQTSEQICHLHKKISPTFELPEILHLITTYNIVNEINGYVETHQLYVEHTPNEEGHSTSSLGRYAVLVDLEPMDSIRDSFIALDSLLHAAGAGQGIPISDLIGILPNISALNDFYHDRDNSPEVKGDLAKICYLHFLKSLDRVAVQILPQIDEKAPEASTGFLSVFHLAMNTYQYYSVPEHKEDCFYLSLALQEHILEFFLKTKNWEFVERYIGRLVETVKKATHPIDMTLIKFKLLYFQFDLDLARNSLTEAILSYQAFEQFIAEKANKITHDNLSQFYLVTRRLGCSGQKLAIALSQQGYHLLAIEICENSYRQFVRLMNKIESAIKPPFFISKDIQDHISRIREDQRKDFDYNMRLFSASHVGALENAVSYMPNLLARQVHESMTLAIQTAEAGDLAYLKAALSKSKLKYKEAGDGLTLLEPLKVNKLTLQRAYRHLSAIKNKALHQTSVAELAPQDEVVAERSSPEYPYFISLFHQRSQPKNKRAPKSKTPTTKPQREVALPPPQPLRIDFGAQFGLYDERAAGVSRIVALQDTYRPHGIYFGMLDPNLPLEIQKRYQQALANVDPTHGLIVPPKGKEGVKFFKKGGVKSWKVKIPGQDIFIVGHIVKDIVEIDQHGLPVKRFLLLFDEIQNHKKEQRDQKTSLRIL